MLVSNLKHWQSCLSYTLVTGMGELGATRSRAQCSPQSHPLSPWYILSLSTFLSITSALIINVLSILHLIAFTSHKTLGGKFCTHFIDYESEAGTD